MPGFNYNSLVCVGRAINQLAHAMFHVHTRESDVEERLKEFLALASASLLRLGQENEKEVIRTRESVYLILHIIVQESNVCRGDSKEVMTNYRGVLGTVQAPVLTSRVSGHLQNLSGEWGDLLILAGLTWHPIRLTG